MAFFKNKYQMIKASDDDIREFFATTIFEGGVFSKEIKSNHAEYFKGHIHSIKIAGEPTNVIGSYINVPVSANEIPEGDCTFKCRVKEEVRQSPSQINFSISPKTLRSKNAPVSVLTKNEGEVDLLDKDGVVIASAGMLLEEYKIAIDPVDDDSKRIFERAGYKVVSSDEFSVGLVKR